MPLLTTRSLLTTEKTPQIAANDKAKTLVAIGAGDKLFKPNDYKESEWTNDNHDISWRVGDGYGYGSEYHHVKAD